MPHVVADRAGPDARHLAPTSNPCSSPTAATARRGAAAVVERTAERPPAAVHHHRGRLQPPPVGASPTPPNCAAIRRGPRPPPGPHRRRPPPLGDLPAAPARSTPSPSPWDYGLVLLVDTARYPLRVRAIHRLLHRLPVADALAAARRPLPGPAPRRAARRRPWTPSRTPAARGQRLPPRRRRRLPPGRPPRPGAPRPHGPAPTAPRPGARLDATVLHATLLDHVWHVPDDSPTTSRYIHDTAADGREGGTRRRHGGADAPRPRGGRPRPGPPGRHDAPQVDVLRPEAGRRAWSCAPRPRLNTRARTGSERPAAARYRRRRGTAVRPPASLARLQRRPRRRLSATSSRSSSTSSCVVDLGLVVLVLVLVVGVGVASARRPRSLGDVLVASRRRRLVVVLVEGVDELHAVQLGEPVGGVRAAVLVGLHGLGEPLARLVLTPGGEQRVGVGVPQPRGPGLHGAGGQLRALQRHDGRVELPHVPPGTGRDEPHLDLAGLVELLHLGLAGHRPAPSRAGRAHARSRP